MHAPGCGLPANVGTPATGYDRRTVFRHAWKAPVKRLTLLILLLLSVLLPRPHTASALDAGWTRVGDMLAEDLDVTRDAAGAIEVWTADTIGYSVFDEGGALRGRLRWPAFGSTTSEWTYRLAAAGSLGAVYTIGGCCPAKSAPTLNVMVPASDVTRLVSFAAAFDVGRGGTSPSAVAVDALGRPWIAVADAVWVLAAGAHTPLTVADDRWIEITRAGGLRIGTIEAMAATADGSMWLVGRNATNGWKLLQYAAAEQIAQVGDYSLPPTTPQLTQLVAGPGGALYLVSADAVWRLPTGGTPDVLVSHATFGAEIKDAAFVGNTLWVATGAGLYRRETAPGAVDHATVFGPVERAGDYWIVPAPGIFWGEVTGFGAADPAGFWHRTDAPVVEGRVSRAFYWGPQDWARTREPYQDAPYGTRRVFYYDKARMEITNPAQPPVTNGLLVVELVTGQRQFGDITFAPGTPATEVVAGDPARDNPDAPTYASYTDVLALRPGQNGERIGQDVLATLTRDGDVGQERTLARAETRIAAYDTVTGHNIPRVFSDFLGQSGPVYGVWNGTSALVHERIMDPLVSMGRPVTEPYWVVTRVAGVEKRVLTQLFERRVLTYTPDNPAGWRVEMGNVGQHYYAWRYDDQPWERQR